MKSAKIIYWVTTILFAGFMIFSAIPNALQTQESIQFITQLGYPKYFVPFIGIAKLLGSVVLLIPGFEKIKEWAYAGLFFDLFGAVYSLIMVYGIDPSMVFMLLVIAVGMLSYVYHHKMVDSKMPTNSFRQQFA